MKTLVRILMLICIFSLIFSLFSGNVFASGKRVIDKTGTLSASEIASLESTTESAESATGVLYRVFVSYSSDNYYKERILSELGFTSYDNVFIMWVEIDSSEIFYELFTYGEAYEKITDTEADRILDNDEVYRIKNGEIVTGASKALSLGVTAITGSLRRPFLDAFIPALIIGAISAAVAAVIVVCSYKRKLKSVTYPLERYTSLRLTASRDTFLGKFVTRVRIRSNSRGGGGGGRSGGGGGGSRGRR